MPDGPSYSPEEAVSQKDINRRTVVKAGLAGLAGALLTNRFDRPATHEVTSPAAPATPEAHEQLMPSEVSEMAIAGPVIMENGFKLFVDKKITEAVLRRLDQALQERPADLVMTPEFSFTVKENEPITLNKTDEGWEVDPSTPEFQRSNIQKLQELAQLHHCDIMAATFPEDSPDGKGSTLLHINPDGKIVGRKRKNDEDTVHPAEGDFTITKNGETYKILPVICGERSFPTEDGSKLTGETIVHEWIKKSVEESGPFDILVHPQSQADIHFEFKAKIDQDPSSLSEISKQNFHKAFMDYYGAYFPYLSENATIMTSDIDISAIMRKDEKGIANYTATKEYASVSSK